MAHDKLQQRIQNRIEQTLYKKQRQHWYNHWWGKLSVVVLFLIVILGVIFGFYVSFYYKRIASGELISRALGDVEQQARLDLLQNAGDPSVGPLTAPVTIVAFEDFECPFSSEAQPVLKRLLTKHQGDVRFIFKDFPLPAIHPNAESAAEAAQCAYEQDKFWEFHDALFANQDRLAEAFYRAIAKDIGLNITQFNECYKTGTYKKKVSEDTELGKSLNVVGTPTFFINGEPVPPVGIDALDSWFEKAIEFITTL